MDDFTDIGSRRKPGRGAVCRAECREQDFTIRAALRLEAEMNKPQWLRRRSWR